MRGEAPLAVPTRLRREWAGATLVTMVAAVAGYVLLSRWWTAWHGLRWVLLAGGLLAIELGLVRVWLRYNRPERAAPLVRTLGVANGLTIARGWLLAALTGFLPLMQPTTWELWVPAGLYGTAVWLDFLDGFYPRRFGQVTVLGAKLDEALDTIGLFVAPLLAVSYGQLPGWYLVVPLAKPTYLGTIWLWRRRSTTTPRSLPDSRLRRPLATAQMVVTVGALSPVLATPVSTWLAGLVVVPYLLVFGRDWLVTTGQL